jgi:hypothetical protein
MRYCMRVLVLDARARASTGRRRTTDLLPAERPQASERAVVSTLYGNGNPGDGNVMWHVTASSRVVVWMWCWALAAALAPLLAPNPIYKPGVQARARPAPPQFVKGLPSFCER